MTWFYLGLYQFEPVSHQPRRYSAVGIEEIRKGSRAARRRLCAAAAVDDLRALRAVQLTGQKPFAGSEWSQTLHAISITSASSLRGRRPSLSGGRCLRG